MLKMCDCNDNIVCRKGKKNTYIDIDARKSKYFIVGYFTGGIPVEFSEATIELDRIKW